jgi:predicted nucleic acid-binding protein
VTVIDASVALEWVIEEDRSGAARELLLGEVLAAPVLMIVECANVLWAKQRRDTINRDLASAVLAAILAAPIDLLPAAGYIAGAQAIASDLDQTLFLGVIYYGPHLKLWLDRVLPAPISSSLPSDVTK